MPRGIYWHKLHSKESIQKGIETRKQKTIEQGYYHSKETIEKIRELNKGKHLSKENIQKRTKWQKTLSTSHQL